jgi:branched-chain amino acid transport system permease protein
MGVKNTDVNTFTFGLVERGGRHPDFHPAAKHRSAWASTQDWAVAAVLGGIGNIPGAAVGGVLIGFLEALVVGYINPTYRDPIVFAVLIVILLLKPSGLLGKSEREKV